jgi:membrane protein DedA with SNARE-associated domain
MRFARRVAGTWRGVWEERGMANLATHLIAAMSGVPVLLIYLLTAIWVGVESAGIGVPVEPVMLFVGSLAAQGQVNVGLVILATGLGCVVFGSLAYVVGLCVGTRAITRYGRFVGLTPARADHIELWLRHRGALGVFLVRLVPLVKTFSSFIAGVADIRYPVFAVGTFLGSLVYCGAWIVLGDVLGANYRKPLEYLDGLDGRGVAIALAIIAIVIVLHHFWGRLALRRLAIHFHRHQ